MPKPAASTSKQQGQQQRLWHAVGCFESLNGSPRRVFVEVRYKHLISPGSSGNHSQPAAVLRQQSCQLLWVQAPALPHRRHINDSWLRLETFLHAHLSVRCCSAEVQPPLTC